MRVPGSHVPAGAGDPGLFVVVVILAAPLTLFARPVAAALAVDSAPGPHRRAALTRFGTRRYSTQ